MRSRWRILGAVVTTSVAAASVSFLTSSHADAARFATPNLVVYRVGGGATLTNAAAPVFLDEYTSSGTKVQSIALPTAAADGNEPLTASGLSRSEGLLSRSADGKYLAVTGYDASVGTLGAGGISLTGTAPTSVPRVVGLVDANGIVDTSTTLSSASAPKIIRSAVTDGDRIWATGGNGGVVSTTLGGGTPAAIAGSASSNFTSLSAQGGALFTGGILTDRVAKVGSGLPTASAALSDLTGLPSNLLTYGYAFADVTSADYAGTGFDTLYLANASTRGGTVDKYRFDGTTWSLVDSDDLEGVTGLVVNNNAGNVSIAATTPQALYGILDTGAAGAATLGDPTKLADAAAGTEFRGVALAPTGTPGPSTYVRSPASGASLSTSSAIPVSAYVKSPSGAVTGVTLTAGAATVNATKGSGDVWSGTVPTTGLSAGANTVTITATGPGGTTTVARTITLVTPSSTPPANPPTTPPTTPPKTTTPTAPANALSAGTYAPTDTKVTARGTWKSYKSAGSPTKKGLVSSKKKSSLTTTVYGSGLTLTFDKTAASGQVSVTIDGKKTVIDLFSPKARKFAKKFKLSGSGSHTVAITVLGTKSAKSKGFAVNVSALQVKS